MVEREQTGARTSSAERKQARPKVNAWTRKAALQDIVGKEEFVTKILIGLESK